MAEVKVYDKISNTVTAYHSTACKNTLVNSSIHQGVATLSHYGLSSSIIRNEANVKCSPVSGSSTIPLPEASSCCATLHRKFW